MVFFSSPADVDVVVDGGGAAAGGRHDRRDEHGGLVGCSVHFDLYLMDRSWGYENEAARLRTLQGQQVVVDGYWLRLPAAAQPPRELAAFPTSYRQTYD